MRSGDEESQTPHDLAGAKFLPDRWILRLVIETLPDLVVRIVNQLLDGRETVADAAPEPVARR